MDGYILSVLDRFVSKMHCGQEKLTNEGLTLLDFARQSGYSKVAVSDYLQYHRLEFTDLLNYPSCVQEEKVWSNA